MTWFLFFYFSDHWKLVYSTVAPGFISQPFSSANPALPAYKQIPQLSISNIIYNSHLT